MFHLWRENHDKNYINKPGIFQTYNILGAAFMIRSNIFKEMGWFDEYYFFCPEDIALSTSLNKKGYTCYVNSNAEIYHYEGMSGKSLSLIQTATMPAAILGEIVFFSNKQKFIMLLLRCLVILSFLLKLCYHFPKSIFGRKPNAYYVLALGDLNCIYACFSSKTPKEIFSFFYKKVNSRK